MPSEGSSKPDPLATTCMCGHTLNWHMTGALARDCTFPACDCKSFEKRPLLIFPEEEARLRHHAGTCEDCDAVDPCPCCGLRISVKQPAEQAEPEETPQGAEEPWPCGDCGATVPAGQGWCTQPDCQKKAQERLKADAPPQPERRPPYAVAYSAGGHAYEALLPGDAVVSAVDGRLVIEHQGFPVLAIERVMPVAVQKEEGDD